MFACVHSGAGGGWSGGSCELSKVGAGLRTELEFSDRAGRKS